MKAKKPNYEPPGWLVTWWDNVRLDIHRAQRLNDFRMRLCEALGSDNELCNPVNLWRIALDLLLDHEAALLSTVDGKPFFVPDMVKNKTEEEES